MELVTLKNLPAAQGETPDDMRLTFPKSRWTFVRCALKDLFMGNLRVNHAFQIWFGIVALAAVGVMAGGRSFGFVTGMIIVFALMARKFSNLYSVLYRGKCFPVLAKEGPQNVACLDDGMRYMRVESAKWTDVHNIRFYRKFLVVEMKDEAESGLFYMWSDDMPKAKATALGLWSHALTGKENPEITPYTETEVNEISDFIEDNFGKYDDVLHEIQSPDVHLDVAIIPPADGRNYYTLCTIGAGAYRMRVPEDLRLAEHVGERAELLMYLPADWNMTEEAFEDERNYWPIRLLKDFARVPVTTDSWLMWGHTMSHDDNQPFAPGVPFHSAVLLCPQPCIDDLVMCPLSSGKTVDFYQVFPLSADEMKYKLWCENTDEYSESPTDAVLNRMHADRDHWTDFALSRFNYRVTPKP